jgi:hypothetical protein
MRASACILVLSLFAAACRRHPEPATPSDEGLQKKLAGVWVCEHKSASGQEMIDTIDLTPGGTYAAVHKLPNRKLGPRTTEESGAWRIEDGVLIITQTATSLRDANAQGPGVERVKIVRLDDRELELEFAGRMIEGISIPTELFVFRKQSQ